MVSRKIRPPALAAVILLLAGAVRPVFPQEAAAAGGDGNIYFYTRTEGGETVFVQHLSWGRAAHAKTYEITVERRRGPGWERAFHAAVRDAFVEFSFPAAEYRYQIQVYDFLNRPAGNTGWHEFSILPALRPELSGWDPVEIKKRASHPPAITLRGNNLSPRARVFLRERAAGTLVEPLTARGVESMDALTLSFDPENLSPGGYDIWVINPGGLETSGGPLTVRVSPAAAGFSRLSFQAGYAPLTPFGGAVFDVFQNFAPLGFYGRGGVFLLKAGSFEAGGEFALVWNYLEESRREFQAQAQILETRFNLLARQGLPPEGLFVNLRLGGGLSSLLDFYFAQDGLESRRFRGIYLSFGGDLSLQWFPVKKPSKYAPFFAEAGLGYTRIALPAGNTAPPGLLRFFAGLGAEF
jgi:hypothetical protein